ncbi:glycosyltransferase family 4 protein [sulfur-oxidizing endosymbiont of Gigantopelta aegis]|uniref:glycosyltransferase family 4 protein n=1 Tax=sulfur-oxidizing endosymbiont of Gigantopelta aegis TaxID=2794934 RepID=UPI0018DCECF0|nr:glycosyltransferase family 4 protein [sulfur-oxidizing endosymbiont of Gigantopelta aegis]
MIKRIKVLHLQQQCSVRIADLQEEIIAALPTTHYEVITAYLTDTPETSTSGVHSSSEKVKYFNFKKKDIKGLRLHLMKTLYAYCKEEKFDLVITHRFKPLDIMLKLNKLLNIPHCICVVHNLDDFNRFYRKLNARIFIDGRWMFVTVSEAVNQYLINIGQPFTQKNVITINNAIDTDKLLNRILSKEEARKQLHLTKNSFVFGTTGRIVTVKGYIYLIQAFEKVYSKHQNEDIKLIIIGDGKLKKQLQEYVNNKGLNETVIFPGEIIDAKLVMSAFDVFVLSSLSEGLPLVLLEAMAAKIPVIATKVGGVPSVITDQGELIEPKDIDQLCLAMEKYYLMNSQQRELLGNKLFMRLIKKFDIKLYREQYLKLITKHMGNLAS